MSDMNFDQVLDAKGLSCPMPIIKARQAIKELLPGQVLKVITTDRGSVKDFQGWAKTSKELLPGQVLKVITTDRGSVKDFQGWAKTSKELALVAQENQEQDGVSLFVHYLEKKA